MTPAVRSAIACRRSYVTQRGEETGPAARAAGDRRTFTNYSNIAILSGHARPSRQAQASPGFRIFPQPATGFRGHPRPAPEKDPATHSIYEAFSEIAVEPVRHGACFVSRRFQVRCAPSRVGGLVQQRLWLVTIGTVGLLAATLAARSTPTQPEATLAASSPQAKPPQAPPPKDRRPGHERLCRQRRLHQMSHRPGRHVREDAARAGEESSHSRGRPGVRNVPRAWQGA